MYAKSYCALALAGDARTMSVKSASSLAHTGLRMSVRAASRSVTAASTTARGRDRLVKSAAPPTIQEAAIRQKPAEGRYARRSAKIVPVGKSRFDVGSDAMQRKRKPSAASERERRRRSAATTSPTSSAGAAQKRASRGPRTRMDHADSSEESRSGRNILQR